VSEDRPKRWWKRWLLTAVKLLIVVLVVCFIHRTLVAAWRQLSEQTWHFSLPWLTLAGIFYLAGTLCCGLFWHRVLRAMGQQAGLGETLRAYYIGHLGKYVPGKAMVVVLRAGLIRSHQVDATLAAISVFFETLTMMAVGAFWAAAIVAIWFRSEPLLFWASLGMMCAAGIPTLPPVFRRLVRLTGAQKWNAATEAGLAGIGYRTVCIGWCLNTLNWVILGLSLWAVVRSLGIEEANAADQLPVCTASVSLATVAGFLSFVPGGAVVREAVLTVLMNPQFGEGAAVAGAILLRLVWLVSELVISGILYGSARRLRTRPATPPSGE
jgi:uncharacterized membrane protein YbhN (UPF0104 family)